MVERVHPREGHFKDLGEKVVEWTLDNTTLPELDEDGNVKDLEAFKAELDEVVNLPEGVTNVKFVIPEVDEDNKDTFTYIIRLPLKELVQQSLKELTTMQKAASNGAPLGSMPYHLPEFYSTFLGQTNQNRKFVDMLYRRIADYTFAHCK